MFFSLLVIVFCGWDGDGIVWLYKDMVVDIFLFGGKKLSFEIVGILYLEKCMRFVD